MNPVGKVLLEIEKPVQDEILLGDNLKLYVDASWNPEWHSCTHGIIKYVPSGVDNINVGDEVAISFFIVADRTYPINDDAYFPTTEGSPYLEKYKNAKGFWLRKQAFPLPGNGIKWAAILQDAKMELIDGTEGTQSDVERWLSQFTFGNKEDYKFTNLVEIEGKPLWKAASFNIFAKKVDGEIISISDRVICQPMQVDFTDRYNIAQGLALPPKSVMGMFTDRGSVISGGENIGLKKGDVIGFQPQFCERYTLWNMECFLVKEDRVDLTYQPEIIHNKPKIILNAN